MVLAPGIEVDGVEAFEAAVPGSDDSIVVALPATGIVESEAVMLATGASVVVDTVVLASVNPLVVTLGATGISSSEAVELGPGASVVLISGVLASVNSVAVALVATGISGPEAVTFDESDSVVVNAVVDSIIIGAVPNVEMSGSAVSGIGS
jgi:hypothetical protein